MKEWKIIEIDRTDVEGLARSCGAAHRLAAALTGIRGLLRPELARTYRNALDEIIARLKAAERWLRELDTQILLAEEVTEYEN